MYSLLSRKPLLHSRNVEETRAFFADKGLDFEVARPPKSSVPLEIHTNGVFLSNLWICYTHFGAPVLLRQTPRPTRWQPPAAADVAGSASKGLGDYWVRIPVHGGFEGSFTRENIFCGPQRGLVTSPSDAYALRTSTDCARLCLSVYGDALMRHVGAMLGDAPIKPLDFDHTITMEEGAGRSLARFMRWTAIELERDSLLWNPLVASQFEQFVMSRLLLSQPNSYTELLRMRERPLAPRDVRRAIEYIHENAAEPITLADLVAVSGVAGRTLFKHFHDFHGVSPIRYLRNVRLQRTHDDLAGGSSQSVTATATKWGFEHMGRFSIDYRRRFGESPSATLAKQRTAQPWIQNRIGAQQT